MMSTESASTDSVNEGEVSNQVLSNMCEPAVNLVSDILLKSATSNLPSTSAVKEIPAASQLCYEGKTATDTSILRAYLTTGEKTIPHSTAVECPKTEEKEYIQDSEVLNVNYDLSQCTANIDLSIFDGVMNEFDQAVSETAIFVQSISDNDFAPITPKRIFKGQGCFSKGRMTTSPLKSKSSLKTVGSMMQNYSKKNGSSGNDEKCKIKINNTTIYPSIAGSFSEDSSSGAEYTVSDLSQGSTFSQETDRDLLKKFSRLKNAVANEIHDCEKLIDSYEASVEKMHAQEIIVAEKQKIVDEARMNFQRAMSALQADKDELIIIQNAVQCSQKSKERANRKLIRSRRKYEQLQRM